MRRFVSGEGVRGQVCGLGLRSVVAIGIGKSSKVAAAWGAGSLGLDILGLEAMVVKIRFRV